ncbi:MAG: type III-A CRISPR-associated RAMP protein Csm5 [Bryobacter sp.]|jgi:CRISPR-associated protein Csm5|nr:type III-A CRISPR-associated RAMP protein Csm5 [Bryobacter sp. CoA8 C33]
MRYRATILTPTLVGDGQALSPIDYMVWKDHVNVLDQGRIFAMMAKRPVFEGYLTQLRKAEKFDFQNWGGLAQSAALRRIPFESPAYSPVWDRARAEDLFIPTFLKGPTGHYLAGSAIRGALRTAVVHKHWMERGEKLFEAWKQQFQNERGYRYAAQPEESASMGSRGRDRMRMVAIGDSKTVPGESFRIYLTRTAKLVKQSESSYRLDWKPAPTFAEMAVPGTLFEGAWKERGNVQFLAASANYWAANQIRLQKQYAQRTGLPVLNQILGELEKRLEIIQGGNRGCLLQIGWGGGFTAKAALGDTSHPSYRDILRRMPFYSSALATGLPFPKTRRIVYLENTPAALPGWIHLECLAS